MEHDIYIKIFCTFAPKFTQRVMYRQLSHITQQIRFRTMPFVRNIIWITVETVEAVETVKTVKTVETDNYPSLQYTNQPNHPYKTVSKSYETTLHAYKMVSQHWESTLHAYKMVFQHWESTLHAYKMVSQHWESTLHAYKMVSQHWESTLHAYKMVSQPHDVYFNTKTLPFLEKGHNNYMNLIKF